jgi:hypothetical protein
MPAVTEKVPPTDDETERKGNAPVAGSGPRVGQLPAEHGARRGVAVRRAAQSRRPAFRTQSGGGRTSGRHENCTCFACAVVLGRSYGAAGAAGPS